MGNKSSKSCPLNYEAAVKLLTPDELERLQASFNRHSSRATDLMSYNSFLVEVLSESVPRNVAEHLFIAFGGNSKGISFKSLVCSLVVITKGSLEDHFKFLFHLFSEDGEVVYGQDAVETLKILEGDDVSLEAVQDFNQKDKMNFEEFMRWALVNKSRVNLLQWLLEHPPLLTNQLTMPTFYQTLAGITHLEEREIIELEKQYWTLIDSRQGKLDLERFKQHVSPPIPQRIVQGLFNAFDENKDNMIDFKEIACGVSACCRGPKTERHKFCFKVFDTNRKNYLTREELQEIVSVCLHVREENSPAAMDIADVSQLDPVYLVEEILKQQHCARDDRMTLEEFLIWSVGDHLMDDFLLVLSQVSHVVLGLHPQNKEDEKQIIKGWVDRELRRGYSFGQTWYLIARSWWHSWEVWVEHQPPTPSSSCPGTPEVGVKFVGGSLFYSESRKSFRDGPPSSMHKRGASYSQVSLNPAVGGVAASGESDFTSPRHHHQTSGSSNSQSDAEIMPIASNFSASKSALPNHQRLLPTHSNELINQDSAFMDTGTLATKGKGGSSHDGSVSDVSYAGMGTNHVSALGQVKTSSSESIGTENSSGGGGGGLSQLRSLRSWSPCPPRSLVGCSTLHASPPRRPTMIDNCSLLSKEKHPYGKLVSLTNEGGQLKAGDLLASGRDFQLVPDKVWLALVHWYNGGSPALPRKVIVSLMSKQLELELYPVVLTLLRHQSIQPAPGSGPSSGRSGSGGVTSMMAVAGGAQFGTNMVTGIGSMTLNAASGMVGYFSSTPRRVPMYTAAFSKTATVGEVFKFLCQTLKLQSDSTRLWLMTKENSDTNMLLEEDHYTLFELEVTVGSQMLIEVRNKDLTWPEEMSSLAQNKGVSIRASSGVLPGMTGLSNLGNTCFMNSALQCVSNTQPLTQYFLTSVYQYELNLQNALGMKGQMASEYAKLLSDLWQGKSRVIAPLKLKWLIGKYAPQFNDFQQHDAQELLSFVLDGLHEDLNRVQQKPYTELEDSDGRPDDVVAAEAWDNHLRRNRSIIVDLFHGLLRSMVRCRECGKESVRFDPFTFLSLPIPLENYVFLNVVVIRLDGSRPVKYGVRLNQDDKVHVLKWRLQELAEISKDAILLADVLPNSLIRSFIPDEKRIRLYANATLYAYETPLKKVISEVIVETKVKNGIIPSALQNGNLAPNRIVSNGAPGGVLKDQSTGAPNSTGGNGHARTFSDMSTLSMSSTLSSGTCWTESVDKILFNGFTVAIHRKMDYQEHYFISYHQPKPSIFGLPLILPADAQMPDGSDGWTGSTLYVDVWRQVGRLVTPLPKQAVNNHATDCDETLYCDYPFVLRVVNKSGRQCAWCPWHQFCAGCTLQTSDRVYSLVGCFVAVDWDTTTLHLRYQHSLERSFAEHESVADLKRIQSQPISLDSCLQAFTSEEHLDGYRCSQCKKDCPAVKKMDVWRLPPILVFHIKRFQFVNDRWMKSCKSVEFPFTRFDPSPYLAQKSTQSPTRLAETTFNSFETDTLNHFSGGDISAPSCSDQRGFEQTDCAPSVPSAQSPLHLAENNGQKDSLLSGNDVPSCSKNQATDDPASRDVTRSDRIGSMGSEKNNIGIHQDNLGFTTGQSSSGGGDVREIDVSNLSADVGAVQLGGFNRSTQQNDSSVIFRNGDRTYVDQLNNPCSGGGSGRVDGGNLRDKPRSSTVPGVARSININGNDSLNNFINDVSVANRDTSSFSSSSVIGQRISGHVTGEPRDRSSTSASANERSLTQHAKKLFSKSNSSSGNGKLFGTKIDHFSYESSDDEKNGSDHNFDFDDNEIDYDYVEDNESPRIHRLSSDSYSATNGDDRPTTSFQANSGDSSIGKINVNDIDSINRDLGQGQLVADGDSAERDSRILAGGPSTSVNNSAESDSTRRTRLYSAMQVLRMPGHGHLLKAGIDPLDVQYDLYALTCHSGMLGAGHYVTYAKNKNNKWALYNDSSCKEVKPDEIETNLAYTLFYERVGLDHAQYMPRVEGAVPKKADSADKDYEEYKKYCSIM